MRSSVCCRRSSRCATRKEEPAPAAPPFLRNVSTCERHCANITCRWLSSNGVWWKWAEIHEATSRCSATKGESRLSRFGSSRTKSGSRASAATQIDSISMAWKPSWRKWLCTVWRSCSGVWRRSRANRVSQSESGMVCIHTLSLSLLNRRENTSRKLLLSL